MEGIYVSYNEENNGNFDEAVAMSNKGYIIWKHGSPSTKQLNFPTKIIIKVTKKEEYYLGDLLLIRPYKDFDPRIFNEDVEHRPSNWITHTGESKTVLFISNLKNVPEPTEVAGMHPPQGIVYIDFNS